MQPHRFDAMTRFLAGPAHRRTVLRGVVLGGILSRLAAPAPASAAVRITAICPLTSPQDAFTSSGHPRFAATFTASSSGKLSRIHIGGNKSDPSKHKFVVQLLAVDPATGFPTDKVLISKAEAVASNSVGPMVVVVQFHKDKTIRLVKDRTYAISISRPDADVDGGGFSVDTRTGDPCPRNRFFVSDQLSGPFQEPAGGVDMSFEVRVGFRRHHDLG